ncbi:DUF6011 domain-containing protein [Streptomyces sp. NPDC046821]|uniref:DUF6011 domain-containing protein n=1 Tax=Streptomyces sp. NPDC046821 TaxID=3154702 RepID=UPI0033C9BD88
MAEWNNNPPTVRTHRGRLVVDVLLPGDSPPPVGTGPRTCVCGRLLTDPVSRARGLGPTCWRRLRGDTPARRTPVAPPTTAIPVIDGQAELPLREHQPTLWSL